MKLGARTQTGAPRASGEQGAQPARASRPQTRAHARRPLAAADIHRLIGVARAVPARAAVATTALLAVTAAACTLLPAEPPELDVRITATDDGARVAIEVRRGPRSTAWVGFGATPLSPAGSAHRVVEVRARGGSGAPLAAVPAGDRAWRIEGIDGGPWTLEYRLLLSPAGADVYHRASSRSADHLILVGADALPRIFASRRSVAPPPDQRPPGEVGLVQVAFERAALPAGWSVVSASPEVAPAGFRLDDHPELAVFAAGPYRVEAVGRNAGMRLAVHEGWSLTPGTLANTATQLVRVLLAQLGPPPASGALLLFTPLPAEVAPSDGVRTAGMAWSRTLVMFGGGPAGVRLPEDRRELREMVAVFVGHELFHLYVPWGVRVTQDLSWLSEGWASHMGRQAALEARLLSGSGFENSLRESYDNYIGMGGARAGNLTDASQGGEQARDLLYARGDLVFRIMSLEWQEQGRAVSFDAALWNRLQARYDGSTPLEAEEVFGTLAAMVSPATVQRFVRDAAMIAPPDLELR